MLKSIWVKRSGHDERLSTLNPMPVSLMKEFDFLKIVKTGVPELGRKLHGMH